MLNKSLRKTPEHSQKHRQKKAGAPQRAPTVDWLPDYDAGFEAWGRAAERAQQEFQIAWQNSQMHRGDEKRHMAVENARQLCVMTWERAYPPGFWEGMADLHAAKTANLEIYVAFLEADPRFFGSGYAKSEVIRGLKRSPLTPEQRRRLQDVVLRVVDKGFRREFRDYCRLARHVQSADWLHEVEARLSSPDPNHALRAQWILEACRQK